MYLSSSAVYAGYGEMAGAVKPGAQKGKNG